ncbi:protein of unknown function DUF214 [Nitrosococcus halophilus Nc 4]|uniref:ABC3 transporter permease protein domain-containing protein n=1 Tax=Nitrosococcus halophilus (strain Nc4) TaxID=472759 RepID=D5C0S1_NITHN|nr:ABC transporter permease [Nitrosococcus halophilus]ADE16394.1 protein of unknown function DUF214 [Nitrosococcus halophilus Nc 4]
MRPLDFLSLTTRALITRPLRSVLTLMGIAVGIATVVLLTSIGEGIHQFVVAEFTQFGTHIIAINPGRTTTTGIPGIAHTVRPLTLADAEALRRLPQVLSVTPIVQGNAEVEARGKSRRTNIYGVGAEFPEALQFEVALGRFLPSDEAQAARAFAVLGSRLRQELFGDTNPLGQRIRVGGDRYRVLGVMESKGQVLGFDIDDAVYLPAAKALELFNRESLMEVDVRYAEDAVEEQIVKSIHNLLLARHGLEDFTITTQQQMLDILGSVLDMLTWAVGALGGISLLVGGIGIVTIMTIAVSERTHEIGLLRALGAERRQILALFLGEALVLAIVGGLAGLLFGIGMIQLLAFLLPALPTHTAWNYVGLAELLAAGIGLAAGVFPARRAAHLDPLECLRAE